MELPARKAHVVGAQCDTFTLLPQSLAALQADPALRLLGSHAAVRVAALLVAAANVVVHGIRFAEHCCGICGQVC